MNKNIHNIKCLSTILIILIFGLFLSSCEDNPTELQDYEPEPMLAAYIYNGEPVEEVYFEWTSSFGTYYDPLSQAIVGANIVIFPLDVADTTGTALYLVDDPALPGHYITPAGVNWLPEGPRPYRIVADKPSENLYCTSTTVVPDTFTVTLYHPSFAGGSVVLLSIPDTLYIADPFTRLDEELFLEWTPSDSAGGFFNNILALTPRDSLVALDPDWEFEEEDEWRLSINFALDDQYEMTMPWFNFNWVGPYHIDMMSGSVDYLDYIYAGSRIMGQGISMDLPNNIEGGIGIFGGMCRYKFNIIMERAVF